MKMFNEIKYRTLTPMITVILSVLITYSASADAGEWIVDQNGCKAWTIRSSGGALNWSGACVNGYEEGNGEQRWSFNGNRAEIYRGNLKSGKRTDVKGSVIWADGGTYEGEVRNNLPDGQGKRTWPSGDAYDGKWANDFQDGRGVYIWPDGSRYDGEWVKGNLQGFGTKTLVKGNSNIANHEREGSGKWIGTHYVVQGLWNADKLAIPCASMEICQKALDSKSKGSDLVKQGYIDAAKWYKTAAEEGSPTAQFRLAVYLFNGFGIKEDTKEAEKWLKKAANQNLPEAQHGYGEFCLINNDKAAAVAWYRKAAEQGFAPSQNDLGLSYSLGRGVKEDPYESVKWYRKAAEQGYAIAQRNLATHIINGSGSKKDPVEAYKWFSKAADQGDAEAQHAMGLMYLDGIGVLKNESEAAKWFRKAAEQGLTKSQFALSTLLHMGVGVKKNDVEGDYWYQKSRSSTKDR